MPNRYQYETVKGRFWVKVDMNGPIPEACPELGNCWLWTKSMRGKGYGRFHMDGKSQPAHCVSYGWAYGPIPSNLELDHLCRIMACVRPAHLEAVTASVNVRRSDSSPGVHSRQTHCIHGHLFNEQNTYMRLGNRNCRTCQNDRAKAKRRRIKQKQQDALFQATGNWGECRCLQLVHQNVRGHALNRYITEANPDCDICSGTGYILKEGRDDR